MKTMYGFEYWDAKAGRWDALMCGIQDASNCFETEAEAEEHLQELADAMDDVDVSELRVVAMEVE